MKSPLKTIIWSFLFGMTTGALMGISIKYPVSRKAIEEAETLCKQTQGVQRVTVGISGKIYKIVCNGGKVYEFN